TSAPAHAHSVTSQPRKDFALSEASILILRQGMAQRRREGLTSALTKAFETIEADTETSFASALGEIIENMIVTVGVGMKDGRWKGEIDSGSRFSSSMGEEFRVRFPLPYDWLPPFMASVYQDLRGALMMGYKLQGNWGQLEYDRATERIKIIPRAQ